MPELPEVETTLRGILPHIGGQTIKKVLIRQPQLRWRVPPQLKKLIQKQVVREISRRGKYLLIHFDVGTMLLHLGMSGRLRVLEKFSSPGRHDHADFQFMNGITLRFTDARRFGAILWTEKDPHHHPLLASLGPEPLTEFFSGDYLKDRAKNKILPVKAFIMDNKTVTGVGNIYATEALFQAGIHPHTAAGEISLLKYQQLAEAIKQVLCSAIEKGGTTLRDFMKSDGSPGYFSVELQVYGRAGKSCYRCQTVLEMLRTGQRSTVFCPQCQN